MSLRDKFRRALGKPLAARRDPIDRLIDDVLAETRDHQWLRDGERPGPRGDDVHDVFDGGDDD